MRPQLLCQIHARTYASHVDNIIPRSRTLRKAPLSLDHFLQRQRTLALWRDIVRATNKIAATDTRREMRDFARQDFERNRNVEDLTQIRYLVSTGKEQLDRMRRYVDELGGK